MTTSLFSEVRSDQPGLPTPERALTIGAHPDDAEFGAGGTLARWASDRCEVSILVVSDGSKGTWDPNIDPLDLIAMRRTEQREAAAALGASGQVVMLNHIDGELTPSMELREELCLWIRRLRPTVILTHDPWRRYMLHPDHRATGMAAVDAVVAARDHLFFPHQLNDGLVKHRPEALLLWAADEPDHFEDVGPTFDRKVAALLCHSSQGQTTMGDAHTDPDALGAFTDRIRDWCARQAEASDFELAESFKLIRP